MNKLHVTWPRNVLFYQVSLFSNIMNKNLQACTLYVLIRSFPHKNTLSLESQQLTYFLNTRIFILPHHNYSIGY